MSFQVESECICDFLCISGHAHWVTVAYQNTNSSLIAGIKTWMKTEVAGRSLVCSRVLVPHWGNPRRERKRRPHLVSCSQWLTQLAFSYSPGPMPGVELPTEVWALLSQLWVKNEAHRLAPGRSDEGSSLIEVFWGDSVLLTKTK